MLNEYCGHEVIKYLFILLKFTVHVLEVLHWH